MAGLAIDDAQGVAAGGEVEVHGLDDGVVLVKEVDGHQVAHGGSGLVHQAAGLAEEDVFGILADLGNLRLADAAGEEQAVDDGTDKHLEGRGRAEAGARQDGGLAVGIKPGHGAAQLGEAGADTPHQGGGGIDFAFLGHQGFQRDGAQGVALGENPDGGGAVHPHRGPGIQVHRGGQHPAPLMVRMVAANLRPPGGGEIPLRRAAKGRGKARVQNFLLCLCQFERL